MSDTISKAQGEAVLAAVKAQFAAYFEPILGDDGKVLAAGWPEPVLIEDYTDSGHPAIVWEEGPDEWPFTLHGGSGEEDRYLAAAAAQEFGLDVEKAVKSVERKPAVLPEGVFVEPINHISIGLYPA